MSSGSDSFSSDDTTQVIFSGYFYYKFKHTNILLDKLFEEIKDYRLCVLGGETFNPHYWDSIIYNVILCVSQLKKAAKREAFPYEAKCYLKPVIAKKKSILSKIVQLEDVTPNINRMLR